MQCLGLKGSMYHICQTFLVFLHLLTLNDCLCRYRLVASKVIDWQGQGYSSEAIKGGWISSLVSLVFRLGLVGNIFWLFVMLREAQAGDLPEQTLILVSLHLY